MTERLPEPAAGPEPEPPARTAGAMLKAAREREGLHLAVLAATIKVSPAKLDALEKDRYDELPNATFVRALAQSVCRSLKIDPRPVLALLPQQESVPLDRSVGRLNTPFQERPSRGDSGNGLAWASKPMFWAGGLLLLAALALGLTPREWIEGAWSDLGAVATQTAVQTAAQASRAGGAASTPIQASAELPRPAPASAVAVAIDAEPSAPAAVAAAQLAAAATAPSSTPPATAATAALPQPAAAVAAVAPPVAAQTPTAPTPAAAPARPGALQIVTTAASWIEVLDAEGQGLLSRVVQPGETLSLDGRRPLRVKVGNAAGTQLAFRGTAVDLAPHTRDNVARVELR